MKTIKNDSTQPQTVAEAEACRQFEASDRAGQALFHPQVEAGQPEPNCVAFFPRIGRFPIIILEGRYSIVGGHWYRHQHNGIQTPVDDPLERAWQAGKAVRSELKRKLDRDAYAIAVAWFPDMPENQDILDEAGGRSVRLLFGDVDLAERLVKLPREHELQPKLSAWDIEQEVAALNGAMAAPDQAAEPQPANERPGAVNVGRVETMNIYITIADAGDDDTPPLITVQGR